MKLNLLAKQKLQFLTLLCKDDLGLFIKHFLIQGGFDRPFNRFHKEFFSMANDKSRGKREIFVAPREHGKSKIVSFAYVIWCLCYEKEPYILLFSDTATQANDFLSDIKEIWQDKDKYPLLSIAFPNVRPALSSDTKKESRNRVNDMILANGVRIASRGAKSRIRGTRFKEHRPTLILLDDIENDENVQSEQQRMKLRRWFNRAIESLGSKTTNILLVGNYIHYDCFLYNMALKKELGYKVNYYQAIERDNKGRDKPLWDGYYTLRELYAKRKKDVQSFEVEWQNNPIVDQERVFELNASSFYNPDNMNMSALTKYMFIDPAFKTQQKHCFSAITLLGVDNNGVKYLIDYVAVKINPKKLIEIIIEKVIQHQPDILGFESNVAQEFVADTLEPDLYKAGFRGSLKKINQTKDKMLRIKTIAAPIATGEIKLDKAILDKEGDELLKELRMFPHVQFDVLDSLSSCNTMIKEFHVHFEYESVSLSNQNVIEMEL